MIQDLTVHRRTVKKIGSILLRPFSTQEILKYGVAEVTNSRITDDTESQVPVYEGINDPRLGTTSKEFSCATCKGEFESCEGHFGYIKLEEPVFNVHFVSFIAKILKLICFSCHRLLAREADRTKLKLMRTNQGKFSYLLRRIPDHRTCSNQSCQLKQPKLRHEKAYEFVLDITNTNALEKFKLKPKTNKETRITLKASDILEMLKGISVEDQNLMGVPSPSNFIIEVLPVSPPSMRPSVVMQNSLRSDDDVTFMYIEILKLNNVLRHLKAKGSNPTTIADMVSNLQYFIGCLSNNGVIGLSEQRHKNGRPLKSISDRIKGKEGRIRGNLMGKRCNFTARSVITPDAMLHLKELGVPKDIALNLTIPVRVTEANENSLKELVENGPFVHPGATKLLMFQNKVRDLARMTKRTDIKLQHGFIVERHLQDGDYVIFNRQPSLHKMSMMAHQVKILPSKTFRLNLSATSPYNADFDGDEMNLSIPQTVEAMTEAREIMAIEKQIVSPQASKPVMGLVQDALLGITLMTQAGVFVDYEDLRIIAGQLMENEILMELKFPTPCIIKPKPLWSGCQLISMLIFDEFNLKSGELPVFKFKPPNQERNRAQEILMTPEESTMSYPLIIREGQIMCGYLTKKQVGSAQNGIIHLFWKNKSPEAAEQFLSYSQIVVNSFLTMLSHSVGVKDCIINKNGQGEVERIIRKFESKVGAIQNLFDVDALELLPGKSPKESMEAHMSQQLSECRIEAGLAAQGKLTIKNKFKRMIIAGSKGTDINISQIMACVGQQSVEGQRIACGFLKRTLPHFPKFGQGMAAKGFVFNSYIRALDPTEFYFHAMGGREGLIDTAVKTSETGYTQRKLVKAMEDLIVAYDGTVRASDNKIYQHVYGYDGMAAEYLEPVNFDWVQQSPEDLIKNCAFYENGKTGSTEEILDNIDSTIIPLYGYEFSKNVKLEDLILKIEKELKRLQEDLAYLRSSKYFIEENTRVFLPFNINRIIWRTLRDSKDHIAQPPERSGGKAHLTYDFVFDKVEGLIRKISVFPGHQLDKDNAKDMIIIEANENAVQLCRIYLRHHLTARNIIVNMNLTEQALQSLCEEVEDKFKQSLVSPGEMVGTLTAHSLGEPATQMTLNTFHFAGVASQNVTLGVPRLKEILNINKNIKTPMLTVYLKAQYEHDEGMARRVASNLQYTVLGDLVASCSVLFDPDDSKSIISKDNVKIKYYMDSLNEKPHCLSPFVMRFELIQEKLTENQVSIEQIVETILKGASYGGIEAIYSDINDEGPCILRVRVNDTIVSSSSEKEDHLQILQDLRLLQNDFLRQLRIKGFPCFRKVYVQEYTNKCFSLDGKLITSGKKYRLLTDGVGINNLTKNRFIDVSRTMSNDLIEVSYVLGIEAARNVIVSEFAEVFGFYGINVSARHLGILSETMTQRGKLTSITRHGVNREAGGFMRRSTFEQSVDILIEAAAMGEEDPLEGISENLILGNLPPLGTGSCHILFNNKEYEQAKILWRAHNVTNDETLNDMMMQKGVMTPGDCSNHIIPGGDTIYGPVHDPEVGFSPGPNSMYCRSEIDAPMQDIGDTVNQITSDFAGTPAGTPAGSPTPSSPHLGSFPSSPQQSGNSPQYGISSPIYQRSPKNSDDEVVLQDRDLGSPRYDSMASPIYQPSAAGMFDGFQAPNSPVYFPNASVSKQASNAFGQSPIYRGNYGQSPAARPIGQSPQGSPRGPAPMQFGTGGGMSPRGASPGLPRGVSPAGQGTPFSGQSPRYSPAGGYGRQANSSGYGGPAPGYSPAGASPAQTSPAPYMQASPAVPYSSGLRPRNAPYPGMSPSVSPNMSPSYQQQQEAQNQPSGQQSSARQPPEDPK